MVFSNVLPECVYLDVLCLLIYNHRNNTSCSHWHHEQTEHVFWGSPYCYCSCDLLYVHLDNKCHQTSYCMGDKLDPCGTVHYVGLNFSNFYLPKFHYIGNTSHFCCCPAVGPVWWWAEFSKRQDLGQMMSVVILVANSRTGHNDYSFLCSSPAKHYINSILNLSSGSHFGIPRCFPTCSNVNSF